MKLDTTLIDRGLTIAGLLTGLLAGLFNQHQLDGLTKRF